MLDSLNKEWLLDYQTKEYEEYDRFLKDFARTGKFEFPPKNRFAKMSDPIVETTNNIWTLIPFYGSSLIHVFPSNRESTIETCGWGTDADINNLIQLAKDTGKVQFILAKDPLDYEKYDYLEPILRELHPPMGRFIPEVIFDEKQLEKAKAEYIPLFYDRLIPHLKTIFEHYQRLDWIGSSFDDFSSKYLANYVTLRLAGYDEIADKILDSTKEDPNLAMHYLHLFGVLIADRIQSDFNLSYNPILSLEADSLRFITNEITKLSQKPKLGFEYYSQDKLQLIDVGQLLVNKLTPTAQGFTGCQSLMQKYEQQDLQKLLSSIQKGLKSKKIDLVKANTSELSTTLDNIWKDLRISKLSSGISFGVPLLLGTIGPMASQLGSDVIGYLGGILAALGFKVIDKKVTPIISDKLAKIFQNDSLVAIYDFKKKYSIKN